MTRAGLYIFTALAMYAASARAGEPTFTQTFHNLVPGWNAIYLNVQPAESDPAVVFAGLPVVSVWTRGIEPGGPEFIKNPEEVLRPELKPPGWLVYVPPGQPDSHLSTLVSIQGNRAFLVRLGEGTPSDHTVTGRPLVPIIPWQANAFNLVGFPIDEDRPPTFASYFESSDALRDQPIYHLLPTGVWERVGVPDVEQMRFGEAYQVYAGSGTSFIAPLAIDVPTSDGLAYAPGVSSLTLRMTNTHHAPATIEIEAMKSPDNAPLSYFHVRTEAPGVGTPEWLPLPSPLQISVRAGTVRSQRLALRREGLSADLGTILAVRDGLGTRWLLPLTAGSGATTAQAVASQAGGDSSSLAGLWVGQAIIDRVSQPNTTPPSFIPVGAAKGTKVCQGGPNVGQACSSDGDCAVYCSLHCGGGSRNGEACTVGQGNTCQGGFDAGASCDPNHNDCPGGGCRRSTPRCSDNLQMECDPFDGGATCAPGATCDFHTLCAGGVNDGQECNAHDCRDGVCAPACEGADCVVPPNRCAGGVNDGLRCGAAAEESPDCQGSPCRALMNRCKGGPRQGALCDGIDANDCPNGACAEVLRCANNHDVECTAANAATVCPGSTCAPVRLCTSGDHLGQECQAHDCPAGVCAAPDDTCLGGDHAGQECSLDKDCPGSRCNAQSRCIGGPNDTRACASHADCGVSSCAAASSPASEFPLRLILHVDKSGKVKLLKQVIQMFQNGTMTRDATDPNTHVTGTHGDYVLLTDDELIPSFGGATLRDGVPVGRRVSTAAFDFPGNDLLMSGSLGCDSNVSTSILLDRDFPTNPYRHPFHPDHDNLSGGASKICSAGSKAGDACTKDAECPGDNARCEEVEEAFNIKRDIELVFGSGKKCSGGDHAGRGCAGDEECPGGTCTARSPQACVDEVEGEYHETIQGLHSKPIAVAGSFKLQRITDTDTLNPGPK